MPLIKRQRASYQAAAVYTLYLVEKQLGCTLQAICNSFLLSMKLILLGTEILMLLGRAWLSPAGIAQNLFY